MQSRGFSKITCFTIFSETGRNGAESCISSTAGTGNNNNKVHFKCISLLGSELNALNQKSSIKNKYSTTVPSCRIRVVEGWKDNENWT